MSNKLMYLHDAGDSHSSLYQLETTVKDINDCRVEIRFAEQDCNWTDKVRGKIAAKLKDHGNGVTVKFMGSKKIELDYSQLVEMMILLQYYNEDSDISNFKSTFIKMLPMRNKDESS